MKPSSRNPVARALRMLRPKVKPSAKVYRRKVRTAVTAGVVVLLSLAGVPRQANAGWFGPSTFEDCILANMKGVTSDYAARVIAAMCRIKFPEKEGER